LKFDWIRVLRDVLMVVVPASLATAGFGTLMVGLPVWTLYAVMLAVLTGGFAVSGCLAGEGRFRHLAIVALGVWLVTVVDSLQQPQRLPANIVQGFIVVALTMVAGWAISLAIKRPAPPPAPPAD
jgi:hypothetical protein